MAATPPHQIRTEVHTPPTPLHGAAHDNLESPPRRHSTRLNQRRTTQDSRLTPETINPTSRKNRSFGTPIGTRRTSQNSTSDLLVANSPRPSPKYRSARRVRVPSPSSPDSESSLPKPTAPSYLRPTIFSSTITMSDGMLPTPIKTPKKKTVPKINGAARALFQEQPILGGEVASPKRARKQRRHNGFSLESFTTNDTSQRGRIEIFTDSRDQLPEPVRSEDNPFADAQVTDGDTPIQQVVASTKRRKTTREKRKDPQVEDAIDRDEGMVYVFRGKKMYRRFDDMDEEEEEIDAEDLGLLEHVSDGAERLPMKTLTRKSIRPKRLFQTEEQQKAREAEREREVSTDIEEQSAPIDVSVEIDGVEVVDLMTPAEPGRVLRSPKKVASGPPGPKASVVERVKEHHKKNGSPFAAWKRLKSSAKSSASPSAKGTKRPASETEESVSTKRVKAD